ERRTHISEYTTRLFPLSFPNSSNFPPDSPRHVHPVFLNERSMQRLLIALALHVIEHRCQRQLQRDEILAKLAELAGRLLEIVSVIERLKRIVGIERRKSSFNFLLVAPILAGRGHDHIGDLKLAKLCGTDLVS